MNTKNTVFSSRMEWFGLLLAGATGVLFAAGLVLSGMTQPAKVQGFLNLRGLFEGAFPGQWDPALGFVMAGAVAVTLLGFALTGQAASKPWFSAKFELPSRKDVDWKLVMGSVLFGVGWGLAGYCPGPALASLLTGGSDVTLFVGAMLAGMGLARWAGRFTG